MHRFTLATCILLTAVTVGSARGHDFWLHASDYRPAPDAPVLLQLVVGERMAGSPVAFDPDRIERFVVLDPGGAGRTVPRSARLRSGALIRTTTRGGHLVGFEGRPALAELSPAKFSAYLREEGLDSIARQLATRPRTGRPVREHYARCAKTLLAVDGDATNFDRPLGLTLELTPLADPTLPGPLPLMLTFQGQPRPDALVVAQHANGLRRSARTDSDGRCRLELAAAGVWMIKSVQMVPSPAADVDWHSYWASLTFEVTE